MANQRQNIRFLGPAIADNLRYWAGGRWRHCRPTPDTSCHIPVDFLGICVASASDPVFDDYVITCLRELGISHVRLDFTYDSHDSLSERFLKRLLDESFRVCLHLVQPPAEVKTLHTNQAQDRWRTFVTGTLQAYADQLDMVEIGATCNRRRWSGYTHASYLVAWQIAWEEAQLFKIKLAAPNVTDFEPFYNVAILGELKRRSMLPAIHTDNLFVERATEPERYDHKILGRRLAGLLRFNLIRKAKVLRDIGVWAGVPETLCAHVAWSLRRIARQLDHVEEKQADYAARYVCLAAASGALRRIYWGPLIGQREGLIDDGTSDYPDMPHVTYYGHCRGSIAGYRRRPAFSAIQTVNRFLAGAKFLRKIPTGPGLEILEFAGGQSSSSLPPSTLLHAVWTTNGNAAEAAACYAPDMLQAAEAYSRDGLKLDRLPPLFTESPVYLVWPDSAGDSKFESRSPRPGIIPGVRFASVPATRYVFLRRPFWTGCCLEQEAGRPYDIAPLLDMLLDKDAPEADGTHAPPRSAIILRDSRNRVWSVPSPGDRTRRLVIKQFRPQRFWRRLTQPRQADRAQRSWNGAQELLRRGIPTPQPIAFLHAPERSGRHASFYICRAFENGGSIREAFTAFSLGASRFQGKSDVDIYAQVAQFLRTLHDRGVFFRDLSAGNLLFRCAPEAELEFALIDTTRARFYPHAIPLCRRVCDLIRLCHPLHWEGRMAFVGTYMQYIGRRFSFWLKIPFAYYDAKHWLKNKLKPWRR